MLSFARLGQSVLAIVVFAGAAAAQGTLTVPQGVLISGTTVSIGFCDPDRAGDVVTIDIHDGHGVIETLDVQLDESGCGSVDWVVPFGIDIAEFVADDGTAATRPVEEPPPVS